LQLEARLGFPIACAAVSLLYSIRTMNWKDDDLLALRELECAVIEVWRRHPEMSDHVVMRAYEAAYQWHRALSRGHEPKPANATGLDAQAMEAVRAAAQKLVTTGPTPEKGNPHGDTAAVKLEVLVGYLRELQRSVERHTSQGGRQGYLSFVRAFLH
jgi:hypothetical protein